MSEQRTDEAALAEARRLAENEVPVSERSPEYNRGLAAGLRFAQRMVTTVLEGDAEPLIALLRRAASVVPTEPLPKEGAPLSEFAAWSDRNLLEETETTIRNWEHQKTVPSEQVLRELFAATRRAAKSSADE